MGVEKQVPGLQVFIISLFLTPLVAILYIYSKKNKSSQINYFYCSECSYIYPVKMNDCPICMEKGIRVKLKKYQSPHNVAELVGVINMS